MPPLRADPDPVGHDASLIRLCDEFIDLTHRLNSIRNGEVRRGGLDSELVAAPVVERRTAVFNALCAAEAATTLDGLRARGRMMVVFQGDDEDFPEGPWPSTMIAALLHDLTQGACDPDAELVGLCNRYALLKKHYQHIHNVQFFADDDAANAAGKDVLAIMDPILKQICTARARGVDGLIARAKALRACCADREDDPCPEQSLIYAMLRDLPELSIGGAA